MALALAIVVLVVIGCDHVDSSLVSPVSDADTLCCESDTLLGTFGIDSPDSVLSYEFYGMSKTQRAEVFVALFRGRFAGEATGIQNLAVAIHGALPSNRNHIVRVYNYNQIGLAKSQIQARINTTHNEMVILIGHSAGGNEALRFVGNWGAAYWTPRGYSGRYILIDHVITIDPVGFYYNLRWGVSGTNYYTKRRTSAIVRGNRVINAANYELTDDTHSCLAGWNACSSWGCRTGRRPVHYFGHTNIDDCAFVRGRVVTLVNRRVAQFPW